jgi:hypothetical protein
MEDLVWTPVCMGICMGVFGILNGVLQFALFAPVVRFLGLRAAFVTFVSGLVPAFPLFPINDTHAHYAGTDVVLLALMFFHLLMMVGVGMTYGKASAPLSALIIPL